MRPRGLRMGSEEGSTMRNFIVCTVHLTVRVIKSRRLTWAGHVARMDKGRSVFSRKETFRKGGPY